MSQNSRRNRARREKLEEKRGKKVITWIIVGLLALGILFCVYTFSMMG